MKGKIWELGPFLLAALVGAYLLTERFAKAPPQPVEISAPGPRQGSQPRQSSGPGDPTKPEDFMPDPNSPPDPNSRPDPALTPAAR